MKKIIRPIRNTCFFISIISFTGFRTDKPHTLPILETINISEITQTTAKSGGNIITDGGEEIKEKGVCWNNISNPNINNFKTSDGTGNDSFESVLINLDADETYFLKVYVVNDLGASYGNEISFTTPSSDTTLEGQIIANHKIVADFDKITSEYISEVKKMMVWFSGESHGYGYRAGLGELEALNSLYDVNQQWGFQPYSTSYLRVTAWPTEGIGEKDWYTWKAYPEGSLPPASTTFKDYIKNNYDASKPISVMGFAWCYDMVHEQGPTANADPISGVHWYGSSDGGLDGNIPWGLNPDDKTVTGNSVNMDTYLSAMEDYITYYTNNNYPTKIVFTTGPVDIYTGEGGYQLSLKNQYIRDYVNNDASRILFDYADILCYDDNGTPTTTEWDGHTYPIITPTNLGAADIGHIGAAGRLRLAKAQWWLLARIAGWDSK